ncbi:GNAT family N-acetyltransferase [Paenibacillus cymbidii]|uniref:GNAT family N-acetyltransferase n=1 Tax=Paenibacillus cymbidii TaxID=1639034 RepID=UPI0010811EC6|nr:GNAT family N-acetyltransferase [Paenibacillus cymbidii]
MEPTSLYHQIEHLAARTWPAPESAPLGHWTLRAADGVTKRANSVLACGERPETVDWFSAVCRFYEARGLPAVFQISDASPTGLDDELEARGFAKVAPCSVLTGDVSAARAAYAGIGAEPGWRLECLPAPDETWLARFIAFELFPESRLPVYRRIFAGIEPQAVFATLFRHGEPAAVGTAIAEQGWTGFTNIAVAPDRRGLGFGQRLMAGLVEWGAANGADNLYLQVVDDNETANRLYRKLGFSRLYGFHYRVAP